MSEPKKVVRARNAPYGLGQIARTFHYPAKINPFMHMRDEMLKEAAPGMTWEEAADEFERGWHYEEQQPT